MGAKNILSQLNIVEVAALTDSGTAFIGFGAKADGLYLKNGAAAELRLLTAGDIGVNVAAFNHTHSGYQASLSGNGFVKISGTTISYDPTTYLSTKANIEAVLTGSISSHYHDLSGYATTGHTHTGVYQPLDADLTAIAALAGTAGLLKKTAADTWALDTTSYVSGTPWTAMGYVTGTPWTGMGYLTSQISHSDVLVDGDFTSQGIMLRGASSGVYSILTDNSANWNTAFGWGNHSGLYSLLAHTHSGYQATLSGTGFVKSTAGVISYDTNTYVTGTPWTGMGYVTGTPWTGMGYLTSQISHADVVVDGDFTSQGIMLRGASAGVYSILADNSVNWNTAFGWGNHSGLYTVIGDRGLVRVGFGSATYGYLDTTYFNNVSGSIEMKLKTVGGSNIFGTGDVPFIVPNASVTYPKLSVYNGASQGNCLTYDSTYGLTWTAMATLSHTHSGVYEPVLGNPATSGYVLSSTTAGVRSWVAQSSSYTLPLAANGTRGGVQIGYANYYGTIGITLSGEQLVCTLTKPTIEYALTGNISSHTHSYEPTLGNPGTNGYVLSSTTAGVRSWVAAAGGYTLPATGVGSLGGIKLGFTATGSAVPLQTSSDMGFVTVTKASVEYVLTGSISTHTHSYAPINGSSSNAFATANLSVTGTISASSTITGSEVYRGSSRALKKNIADFDFDAIGFLNDVSIMRYYLKSNNQFGIGFIAEDTHPWLSGDDQKSHVFGNHLGLLTKAIQEEDQKVENLKLEVLELRARVRELEIARANGWN